jgi:hypothetical protein
METFAAIYLSEWACGFYTGLAIGLAGIIGLHLRVRSLWGPSSGACDKRG